MVLGLCCSSALFLGAAFIGIALAMQGEGVDWFVNIVGGLFFGVGGVVLARQASVLAVPRYGALRLVGGTEVRGRLGPRFVATTVVAVLHTALTAVAVWNAVGHVEPPVDWTSVPTGLSLAAFAAMIDVFVVGYAVGMYRASRMVLMSINDEGVSTATVIDPPAYTRWDDVSAWTTTPESVFVPTIGRDIRHHIVWRFGAESVRTPVDLRPSADAITREIARRAPNARTR